MLLNISLANSIDAARLAARMRITALGGAGTNRRFQDVGALDVLPANYSMMPDLVAQGRLGIDVVLVQLAADGPAYNLSLMVDHLADAIPRARTVVAEVNDALPVTFGETSVPAGDIDHRILAGRVDPATTTFASANDLASALRRAAAAHGQHEARTGQADSNWPDWYAEYMVREQAGQELPK